jgi:hypothetical protein
LHNLYALNLECEHVYYFEHLKDNNLLKDKGGKWIDEIKEIPYDLGGKNPTGFVGSRRSSKKTKIYKEHSSNSTEQKSLTK